MRAIAISKKYICIAYQIHHQQQQISSRLSFGGIVSYFKKHHLMTTVIILQIPQINSERDNSDENN